MATYTLRKARQLELKIRDVISKHRILTAVRFPAYGKWQTADSIRYEVNELQQSAILQIQDILWLHSIRSAIRRSIQEANEESGINTLITDRLLAECKRATLTNFINENDRSLTGDMFDYSFDNVELQLQVMRDSQVAAKESYGSRTSVTVPLFSKKDLEFYEDAIRDCDRELEGCDDSILRLNTSTTIELSSVDIEKLRQLKILI